MQWTQARCAQKMNPSVIRDILKVTEKPGIISFASGLPSPKTFPVSAFSAACEKVLREDGQAALQYAASEGYARLREMVAAMLPWPVEPAQILITTGSQQGLDLIAKVLRIWLKITSRNRMNLEAAKKGCDDVNWSEMNWEQKR